LAALAAAHAAAGPSPQVKTYTSTPAGPAPLADDLYLSVLRHSGGAAAGTTRGSKSKVSISPDGRHTLVLQPSAAAAAAAIQAEAQLHAQTLAETDDTAAAVAQMQAQHLKFHLADGRLRAHGEPSEPPPDANHMHGTSPNSNNVRLTAGPAPPPAFPYPYPDPHRSPQDDALHRLHALAALMSEDM
jgi:hypothetical protein